MPMLFALTRIQRQCHYPSSYLVAPQEVATTLTCAASQVRCWPGQGICRLFLLGALLPNLLLQAPNQVWFSVSGQSPTSFLILWERRAIKWAGGMQWRKGPEVSQATKTSFARLFPMVHAKHTAGSVVTHATSLLSSAWCDPFTAYAAGILGFAGPLQGRANQEFICMLRDLPGIHSGRSITWRVPAEEALKQSDGKTMYGFMVEFAKKHKLAEKSSLVALARHLGQELPPILQKLSGAVQPFPNPDAISGVLLQEAWASGPRSSIQLCLRNLVPLVLWQQLLGSACLASQSSVLSLFPSSSAASK